MYELARKLVLIVPVVAVVGCGQSPVSYKADVKPFVDKYCIRCHVQGGQGSAVSGLHMDTYESLMQGTKYGAVVKPGESFTSALVMLVEGRADPALAMPHDDIPLPITFPDAALSLQCEHEIGDAL